LNIEKTNIESLTNKLTIIEDDLAKLKGGSAIDLS
jgi:hypothetical protein